MTVKIQSIEPYEEILNQTYGDIAIIRVVQLRALAALWAWQMRKDKRENQRNGYESDYAYGGSRALYNAYKSLLTRAKRVKPGTLYKAGITLGDF